MGTIRKKTAPKKAKTMVAGVDRSWWDEFFIHFQKVKHAPAAAKFCGTNMQAVNNAKRENEDFRRAYEDIWDGLTLELESNAMQRASEGWDKPVWYQGELVGYERVYSNSLTIFMLKANHPERYHLERQVADRSAEEQARLLRSFFHQTDPANPFEPIVDEPRTKTPPTPSRN